VRLVLAATGAELLEFEALRCRLLVLGVRIIPFLALLALERDNFPRHCLTPCSCLYCSLALAMGGDQRSAFGGQRSAFSGQLSAISFQRSASSHQLSAISFV
jgi:hypothetical protein